MEPFSKELPLFSFQIPKEDFSTRQTNHKFTIRKKGETIDLKILKFGGWCRHINY